MLQLVVSMVVVIALIYVTGWIYSKLNIVNRNNLKKLAQKEFDTDRFTVLQSMSLGQQRHLYSIEMNGKVLLVRQYRYAYGEEILEIPAGKLNPGEDPALTAARELKEETGIEAASLRHLFTLYPTPGYTDEKIYIYCAEGAADGQAHLDEGEFLNVEWRELNCVTDMIGRGEIRDAKTIVAVQWYLLQQK